MWWNKQNLDKPIRAADGTLWHFRVWHDHIDGTYIQRIYFWSEDHQSTGCIELPDDKAIHVSRIKQRIRKIVTDGAYREKFRRPLQFPVERYYA